MRLWRISGSSERARGALVARAGAGPGRSAAVRGNFILKWTLSVASPQRVLWQNNPAGWYDPRP